MVIRVRTGAWVESLVRGSGKSLTKFCYVKKKKRVRLALPMISSVIVRFKDLRDKTRLISSYIERTGSTSSVPFPCDRADSGSPDPLTRRRECSVGREEEARLL